jgi:hypothetical protein
MEKYTTADIISKLEIEKASLDVDKDKDKIKELDIAIEKEGTKIILTNDAFAVVDMLNELVRLNMIERGR